jgi:hypothetical protein
LAALPGEARRPWRLRPTDLQSGGAMITVYRSTPQGVAQIHEPVDGSWIQLVNPDLDELEQI